MSIINVDQEVVALLSTGIKNSAEELRTFSHILCVDERSTIMANANGRETFMENLNVLRALGEALSNSATQIVEISQGFENLDQSFRTQFTN